MQSCPVVDPDRPNVAVFVGILRCMGATENARHEMRDQIAGVENAGKVSMESQIVKNCLKVVVFVCRVIPSV